MFLLGLNRSPWQRDPTDAHAHEQQADTPVTLESGKADISSTPGTSGWITPKTTYPNSPVWIDLIKGIEAFAIQKPARSTAIVLGKNYLAGQMKGRTRNLYGHQQTHTKVCRLYDGTHRRLYVHRFVSPDVYSREGKFASKNFGVDSRDLLTIVCSSKVNLRYVHDRIRTASAFAERPCANNRSSIFATQI